MIIGVDGSNLRSGGGVTHLVQLLEVAEPESHGIERIHVWASRDTLDALPDRPWLSTESDDRLEGSLLARLAWQRRDLPRLAADCDLLFAPGGSLPHRFSPAVTMCRNMLPFELGELRRYGISRMTLRLLLLRFSQMRSFARAEGLIFLTSYAERQVKDVVSLEGTSTVIPHGISPVFLEPPRAQKPLNAYSDERPLRLLYVSIVDVYKHQAQVARAVARLRRKGLPLQLDLVGPSYPPAERGLRRVLRKEDPEGRFLRYEGPVPHRELPARLSRADVGVFASSCENMPNILLETMAAGIPIACAERGPMPEILGGAGVYFDPESPDSIASALRTLVADPSLRARTAEAAHSAAQAFSWDRCASATLDFLARTARAGGADRG